MNAFDLWYVYYDSHILPNKKSFSLSARLLQNLDFQSILLSPWPDCKPLPQLTQSFHILQRFIQDPINWVTCDCDATCLESVESELNRFELMLALEKIYGKDFWGSNRRRVQASVVHLHSYLRSMVFALLPRNCQNLRQASSEGKLCTKLQYLQILSQQLLLRLDSIKEFMLSKRFEEEKNLTIVFLFELKQLLENFTTINRKQLDKASSELGKYIQIIAPIELSRQNYGFKVKKKKNSFMMFTVEAHNQNQRREEGVNDQRQVNSDVEDNSPGLEMGKSKSRERRKGSTPNSYLMGQRKDGDKIQISSEKIQTLIYNKETKQKVRQLEKRQSNEGLPIIFQFRENIRKHSIHLSKKKSNRSHQLNYSPSQEKHSSTTTKYPLRKASEFTPPKEASKEKKTKSTSITKLKNSVGSSIRSKRSSFHQIQHRVFEVEKESERIQVQKQFYSPFKGLRQQEYQSVRRGDRKRQENYLSERFFPGSSPLQKDQDKESLYQKDQVFQFQQQIKSQNNTLIEKTRKKNSGVKILLEEGSISMANVQTQHCLMQEVRAQIRQIIKERSSDDGMEAETDDFEEILSLY